MGDSIKQEETRPRTAFMEWTETVARLTAAVFFLYVFLAGVKSLEKGISAFGSDFVDQVFSSVANPIAGLAAGVLATVLVQSSSVTTATIVGLVGSGVLPVEAAVPMVMGANIGTTVTNTLASLGHMRQSAYSNEPSPRQRSTTTSIFSVWWFCSRSRSPSVSYPESPGVWRRYSTGCCPQSTRMAARSRMR